MMKQNSKRILALSMAVCLPFMQVISAAAAPAASSELPSKQEVIYANLNTDGTLSETTVVNIWDRENSTTITDYGNYSSVKNLTTMDEIEFSNGTVKIDTEKSNEKLYYEGSLNNAQLPWKFQLHYYMDGTEYNAEELAGKSGDLKITMSVRKNTACQGTFFDNYALQASFTLDTKLCRNIEAEGATAANVGSDKQLTYTILPGKETDITITAEVTDFEMDAVAINGIPLSLNVEVDDEELMSQVTELLEGIEQLDDGAGELQDGISELQDGAEGDLKSGVNELNDGASQLQDGASQLKDGGSSVKDGASELNDGAKALEKGLKTLNQGIEQIEGGLAALDSKSADLTNGSAQVKSALKQIKTALNAVSASSESIEQLLSASAAIKQGISDITSGVTALEEGVSYQAYKNIMKQNGLDLDELKAGNDAAIENLQSLQSSLDKISGQLDAMENISIQNTPDISIEQLNAIISVLKLAGMDDATLEALKTQLGNSSQLAALKAQLEALKTQLEQLSSQTNQVSQLILLLQGNNANIQGIEQYLTTINANIKELETGAAALKESYNQFDQAIGTLADTLEDLLYQVSALTAAINTLSSQYETLDQGLNDYTDGVSAIVAGCKQVSAGAEELVYGSSELTNGSSALYNGTAELLTGISEFYQATGTLKDGTGQLDEGVAELLAGISALYDGSGELKDGTSQMRDETSGMDTEISDKIDELLATISGDNTDITSFVSDKNTNVEAVQFVIQTAAIEIPEEPEAEETSEEELSFWEKLLALFGL